MINGCRAAHKMKNVKHKIMYVVYGLFGAFIGFLVHLMALGGWGYLLTGRSKPWNGLLSLILLVVVGGGWGVVAYRFCDREFDSGASGFYGDESSAMLFTKRLMVLLSCGVAVYFIWQLARRI